jgi:hypothetical protein
VARPRRSEGGLGWILKGAEFSFRLKLTNKQPQSFCKPRQCASRPQHFSTLTACYRWLRRMKRSASLRVQCLRRRVFTFQQVTAGFRSSHVRTLVNDHHRDYFSFTRSVEQELARPTVEGVLKKTLVVVPCCCKRITPALSTSTKSTTLLVERPAAVCGGP